MGLQNHRRVLKVHKVPKTTKDYAAKLAIRFTYATNGRSFYGIDMQTEVF